MKILVIQTADICDVILITPLIKQLKTISPSSQIDVIVRAEFGKLLKNNPNVNRIILLNKKIGIIGFKRFKNEIKNTGYDMSFSLDYSFKTGRIVHAARIRTRFGFKTGFQKHLLTESIAIPKNFHEKNKYLNLISLLSQSPHYSLSTELFPSADDSNKAEKMMDSFLSTTILITPGSVCFTKRWLLEYYLELTQRLIEHEFCVVLSGNQSDREMCDYIIQNVTKKNRIKNIAGEFNILETAAVIGKVPLVICNDSEALHIANAMNTPVFAFYGPTDKSLGYFPYRENDYIFAANIPCRPCSKPNSKSCPEKHFGCMKRISVESVMKKILDFFDVEKQLNSFD